MSVSRRSLVRGSAWVAPVVLASTAIPAYAASPTCPEVSWEEITILEEGYQFWLDFVNAESTKTYTFTTSDGVFGQPDSEYVSLSEDGKTLTATKSDSNDYFGVSFTVISEAPSVVVNYIIDGSCSGQLVKSRPADTCPTDYSFSSDHALGDLPVIAYDDVAQATISVSSMPQDAVVSAYRMEFDPSTLDTSLWELVSPTEVKYVGEANQPVNYTFTFANVKEPDYAYNPYRAMGGNGWQSPAWNDACTQYGVPAGGVACVRGYDVPGDKAHHVYLYSVATEASLTLTSKSCELKYVEKFYADYVNSQSALAYKVENLSVTPDAITFTYTGSLRGLMVYTDATDEVPMLNAPKPFTPVMSRDGFMMYTMSNERVTAKTFTIPLSGMTHNVHIGRFILGEEFSEYAFIVGSDPAVFSSPLSRFSNYVHIVVSLLIAK